MRKFILKPNYYFVEGSLHSFLTFRNGISYLKIIGFAQDITGLYPGQYYPILTNIMLTSHSLSLCTRGSVINHHAASRTTAKVPVIYSQINSRLFVIVTKKFVLMLLKYRFMICLPYCKNWNEVQLNSTVYDFYKDIDVLFK